MRVACYNCNFTINTAGMYADLVVPTKLFVVQGV